MNGDNVLAREEEKDARKSQGRLHIQLSLKSSIRIGEEVDKIEKEDEEGGGFDKIKPHVDTSRWKEDKKRMMKGLRCGWKI